MTRNGTSCSAATCGDQRLGAVPAGHAEEVRAAGESIAGELLDVGSRPVQQRHLGPSSSARSRSRNRRDLAAARARVHDQERVPRGGGLGGPSAPTPSGRDAARRGRRRSRRSTSRRPPRPPRAAGRPRRPRDAPPVPPRRGSGPASAAGPAEQEPEQGGDDDDGRRRRSAARSHRPRRPAKASRTTNATTTSARQARAHQVRARIDSTAHLPEAILAVRGWPARRAGRSPAADGSAASPTVTPRSAPPGCPASSAGHGPTDATP